MGNLYFDICFNLEMKARSILGKSDLEARGTYISATCIQAGTFVEVMLRLLRDKLGENADLSEFMDKTKGFYGASLKESDYDAIMDAFDLFNALLNE